MARRIAAVLLLFAARLASAQVATGNSITVTETNDQDQTINIAECNNAEPDGLVFTWTYTNFVTPGTYRLTVSDTSACPSTGKNKVFDNIQATAANGSHPSNGSVNVSTLLGQLGINCNSSATAVYLCIDYLPSSGASVTAAITGSIKLDLARPPKPINVTPRAGDSALNISWTAGTGSSTDNTVGSSSSYDVVVTAQGDPADTRTQSVTSTSTRVGGLKNGVTYKVQVVAFSPGGNESDPSDEALGVPIEINDFWRLYRNAGGKEQGGCSSGGAAIAALLGIVPFALRRRRRS